MNDNIAIKEILRTDLFFDVFVEELTTVFYNQFEWSPEIITQLTGTQGWTVSFTNTCLKCRLNNVLEYYKELHYTESDIFDTKLAQLINIMCFDENNELVNKDTMVKCYTPVWNDFQIRECVYADGHKDNNVFDVVKWQNTCANKTNTNTCFTVATIHYNQHDRTFELHSCGMRFLTNYEEGLCEWILDWCNKYTEERI